MRGSTGVRLGALGAFLLMVACGGGGDGGQGGSAELAASELVAPLNGGYKVKPDGTRVPPQADELPVAIGSVEAHWYRAGGVYVIAFGGLDLEESGPLCPGSSIQTDSGFEQVTNSPTEENACEGAPKLAAEDAGVRTCGPLVLYITEIPDDTEGQLFASVERYEENGTIVGATGVVAADMEAAPEIDPGAGEYIIPDGLIEGTTEVSC